VDGGVDGNRGYVVKAGAELLVRERGVGHGEFGERGMGRRGRRCDAAYGEVAEVGKILASGSLRGRFRLRFFAYSVDRLRKTTATF